MKKLLLGALTIGLAALPISANAQGFANISVKGNTTATVGEEIKVDINISNIKDLENGMVGYSASVNFDDTCLNYVGYEEKTNTPYNFIINENNYRIGGLDTSLTNGVKEDTTLYTLKFKVVNACKSNISISNIKLSDINAKPITVVENNTLTIDAKEAVKEEKVEEIKPVVKTTTTKTTTTTTKVAETTTESTTVETTTTQKVEEEKTVEELKTTKKKDNAFVKAIKNIFSFIKSIFKKEV